MYLVAVNMQRACCALDIVLKTVATEFSYSIARILI